MECPGNDPGVYDRGAREKDGEMWFGSDGDRGKWVARPGKIQHCRRKYNDVFTEGLGEKVHVWRLWSTVTHQGQFLGKTQ